MIVFIVYKGYRTVFYNSLNRSKAIYSITWRFIEQCHAYAAFAAKAVRLEIR
jgi:hypothetical protein